jgi:hypothetical protein
MLLPDYRIRALVEAGEPGIRPWRPKLPQPQGQMSTSAPSSWSTVHRTAGRRVRGAAGRRHASQARPGRETDAIDAQRIAEILSYGLLRPSFVLKRPFRELRDLTR